MSESDHQNTSDAYDQAILNMQGVLKGMQSLGDQLVGLAQGLGQTLLRTEEKTRGLEVSFITSSCMCSQLTCSRLKSRRMSQLSARRGS